MTSLFSLIAEFTDEAPLFRLSPDTIATRLPLLRHLAAFCGDAVDGITVETARLWLRTVAREPARGRGTKRASSTVNQYRKAGKVFCQWLVWRGYLDSNPFEKTLSLPEEDRMLPVPGADDLLAVLRTVRLGPGSEERRLRDYLFILLISDTGMRLAEVLGSESLPGVNVPDVWDGERVRESLAFWGKGKRGKARARAVSLNPAVRDAIRRYLAVRRALPGVDALFVGVTGERWKAIGARRSLGRACVAAGVPLMSPHRLRAFALSSWHDQEIDWLAYKALSGHTDDRTVHRYAAAAVARRAIRTHRRMSPVAAMVAAG